MTNSYSFSFDRAAAFNRTERLSETAFRNVGEEAQPVFRRTATRADLLDAVYASCPSLPRSQARDVFEMALVEISDALMQGETVKLRSFGHFAVREKRERIGRNPRTGVEVPIKPRRVLTFKPSPVLLDQVNGREPGDGHEG